MIERTPHIVEAPSRARQVLWFIGIWLASVAALAIVAYGIKFALRH